MRSKYKPQWERHAAATVETLTVPGLLSVYPDFFCNTVDLYIYIGVFHIDQHPGGYGSISYFKEILDAKGSSRGRTLVFSRFDPPPGEAPL